MSERICLTICWLSFFVLSIVITELYFLRTDHKGIRLLVEGDRGPIYLRLISIYSGYLGAIIAFWYMKPFKSAQGDSDVQFRFYLALICTILLNLILLYLVGRQHLLLNGSVLDDIRFATKVTILLSFLVAPVNAWYFGIKSKTPQQDKSVESNKGK